MSSITSTLHVPKTARLSIIERNC